MFSGTVAVLSLSIALLLATQADKQLAGAGVYRTLLIWPYAVAPAIAGVLWAFMFQPSLGVVARGLRDTFGIDWNPLLNEQPRHDHGRACRDLEADLVQLPVLPRGPCTRSRAACMEAAAIDGARPMRRFWTITFPLLSPTTFFLIVVNIVYAFFDTLGIIDAMTGGGPGKGDRDAGL